MGGEESKPVIPKNTDVNLDYHPIPPAKVVPMVKQVLKSGRPPTADEIRRAALSGATITPDVLREAGIVEPIITIIKETLTRDAAVGLGPVPQAWWDITDRRPKTNVALAVAGLNLTQADPSGAAAAAGAQAKSGPSPLLWLGLAALIGGGLYMTKGR